MLPMFLPPMFLPVLAGIVARGAAVLGRFAVGAGRAMASGGGKFGQTLGKAAQRAGVAMQRGAQAGQAGGGFRGRGGLGGGGIPNQKPTGGRRRPVTPGRARGRRRPRKSVSFTQAFSRSVRRGARGAIQKQRNGGGGSQFIQKLFDSKSFLGRVTQNFGSAQTNFKKGNNVDGMMDSLKVVGDVGKPLAKGMAILGAATAGTAITIAMLPKLIKDWGASLIESKRYLEEHSAAHSIAIGRLDIARFNRNVRLGAATSGTFSNMTRSQNKLEERLLPYQIASVNLLTRMVTLLSEMAVAGIDTAEFTHEMAKGASRNYLVLDLIRQAIVGNGAGGVQNNPLADLAVGMARGNFVQRVRPPMPGMGPVAQPRNQPMGGAGGGIMGGGAGAAIRHGGGFGA